MADRPESVTFQQFEHAVRGIHERVGAALAQTLRTDSAPEETDRVAAYALLVSDFYYLLQWLWLEWPSFDPAQGQWMAGMDAWLSRLRGEEVSDLSIPGHIRLWTQLLRGPGYADELRELLDPAPRCVLLLREHDALQGTVHARDVSEHMLRFAAWALQQNVSDWQHAEQKWTTLAAWLTDVGPVAAALPVSRALVGGLTADTARLNGMSGHRPGAAIATEVASVRADAWMTSPELDEALLQLDALVGLKQVKAEVRSLVNLLRINRLRQTRGLPALDVTRHMVFYGGPGTGKTTVARLLARIFQALGVLKKGHLVETDRSGLVAAYVGQTALKVKRVVNQADQGVLFIDEAYALARGENDFGGEAIETLLKLMEDRRDSLVVIVAGYTDRMQTFIASNPGLKSRFTRYFNFEDYDASQLCDILVRITAQHGLNLTPAALAHVQDVMQQARHRASMEAGNARFVRNCFEKATMAQANRLAEQAGVAPVSNAELTTLECSDVQWALAESLREPG